MRPLMRAGLGLAVALAAIPAASGAAAPVTPSLTLAAGTVGPGERYVVHGEGWSRASGCSRQVQVSRRLRHGVRLGSAAVAEDGSFRFSRRVPGRARRGARIVLDVTQYCRTDAGSVGTTRTVRIRVGRPAIECLRPLSVDATAYVLAVSGGLRCREGAEAIGSFIDTGIEPPGFLCSRLGAPTGLDFVCLRTDRPVRRVTARRIREV